MNHIPSTTRQPGDASTPHPESAKTGRRPVPRNLIYRSDPAEFDADVTELWAMTVDERIAAMRARQLTGTQLTEWSGHRPDQVPCIDGEFEYHVMCTDEYLDSHEPVTASNVVALPRRQEVDDVAA